MLDVEGHHREAAITIRRTNSARPCAAERGDHHPDHRNQQQDQRHGEWLSKTGSDIRDDKSV